MSSENWADRTQQSWGPWSPHRVCGSLFCRPDGSRTPPHPSRNQHSSSQKLTAQRRILATQGTLSKSPSVYSGREILGLGGGGWALGFLATCLPLPPTSPPPPSCSIPPVLLQADLPPPGLSCWFKPGPFLEASRSPRCSVHSLT